MVVNLILNCDIKPCPRPRVGKFTSKAYLPNHGQDVLESEILWKLVEQRISPRTLKFDTVIAILRPTRGDIDNRLKTLMDALASITGHDDRNIKKVVCEIDENIAYNLITLTNRKEESHDNTR